MTHGHHGRAAAPAHRGAGSNHCTICTPKGQRASTNSERQSVSVLQCGWKRQTEWEGVIQQHVPQRADWASWHMTAPGLLRPAMSRLMLTVVENGRKWRLGFGETGSEGVRSRGSWIPYNSDTGNMHAVFYVLKWLIFVCWWSSYRCVRGETIQMSLCSIRVAVFESIGPSLIEWDRKIRSYWWWDFSFTLHCNGCQSLLVWIFGCCSSLLRPCLSRSSVPLLSTSPRTCLLCHL